MQQDEQRQFWFHFCCKWLTSNKFFIRETVATNLFQGRRQSKLVTSDVLMLSQSLSGDLAAFSLLNLFSINKDMLFNKNWKCLYPTALKKEVNDPLKMQIMCQRSVTQLSPFQDEKTASGRGRDLLKITLIQSLTFCIYTFYLKSKERNTPIVGLKSLYFLPEKDVKIRTKAS